jgi:hypothetical protein
MNLLNKWRQISGNKMTILPVSLSTICVQRKEGKSPHIPTLSELSAAYCSYCSSCIASGLGSRGDLDVVGRTEVVFTGWVNQQPDIYRTSRYINNSHINTITACYKPVLNTKSSTFTLPFTSGFSHISMSFEILKACLVLQHAMFSSI